MNSDQLNLISKKIRKYLEKKIFYRKTHFFVVFKNTQESNLEQSHISENLEDHVSAMMQMDKHI